MSKQNHTKMCVPTVAQCPIFEKNRQVGFPDFFFKKKQQKSTENYIQTREEFELSRLGKQACFNTLIKSDPYVQSFYHRIPKVQTSKILTSTAKYLRGVPAIEIIPDWIKNVSQPENSLENKL